MVKIIREPYPGYGDPIFREGVTSFVPGASRKRERTPPSAPDAGPSAADDAVKQERPAGTSAAGRLAGVRPKPSA